MKFAWPEIQRRSVRLPVESSWPYKMAQHASRNSVRRIKLFESSGSLEGLLRHLVRKRRVPQSGALLLPGCEAPAQKRFHEFGFRGVGEVFRNDKVRKRGDGIRARP